MQTIKIEETTKRYLSTIRYLKHIQKTGKIHLLTRSQRNALRSRLSRYMSSIKRYLKLVTLSTGLCAASFIDIDAQCQMNRLPISTQTSFSTFQGGQKPTFVDIDTDGDYDLIVGNTQGTISAYENRDGFFKPLYGLLNPFDSIDVGTVASPTFADIDNDGDSDVFIGSTYGTIQFYRNDNGAFSEVTGTDNPFNEVNVGFASAPTFVDLENDGDLDVFIGESDGAINFFINNDGVFSEVTGTGNPFNGIDVGIRSSPAFVDIDNDGDSDAFIGKRDGIINFYRNNNGVFDEVTGGPNPFNGIDVRPKSNSAPTFIDIDGDGDQDAFVGENSGTIRFFRNGIRTVFSEVIHLDISFNSVEMGFFASPTFGDLDGDNDEDVVVGSRDGILQSFINTNGVFSEAVGTDNQFDGINVGSFAKPVLVDIDPIDLDTDLDLVVGRSDGRILYYRNTNGSFALLSGAADPFLGINIGSNSAPTFIDFDSDNDKDAFVGTEDGTIHYLRNDDGTFTEVTGVGNPFNGIDVGDNATPSFLRFDIFRALVGAEDGTITEFEKIGNKYEPVADSPFIGVDVGDFSSPTFVLNANSTESDTVIIGNLNGRLFAFNDQGERSNVWQDPDNSDWHADPSNWELMTIPKSGCDEVHVFGGSVLKVDPSQIAEGRTMTVRQGGLFEVKAAAELSIDPD